MSEIIDSHAAHQPAWEVQRADYSLQYNIKRSIGFEDVTFMSLCTPANTPAAPIIEKLLIASNKCGDISVQVVVAAGKNQHALRTMFAHGVNFEPLAIISPDKRFKGGITLRAGIDGDEKLLNFIAAIHTLTPLSPQLTTYLRECLHYKDGCLGDEYYNTKYQRELPILAEAVLTGYEMKDPSFVSHPEVKLKHAHTQQQRFYPEFGLQQPHEIPDIHWAILHRQYQHLQEILQDNPRKLLQLCPYGWDPLMLAVQLESIEAINILYCYSQMIHVEFAPTAMRFSAEAIAAKQRYHHNLNCEIRRFFATTHCEQIKEEEFQRVKVAHPNDAHTAGMNAKDRKQYYALFHELYSQPIPTRPPLHQLAIEGNLAAIQAEVTCTTRNEAEIAELFTTPDSQGFSPLYYAIIMNRVDVVRYMLEHGASPNPYKHALRVPIDGYVIWNDVHMNPVDVASPAVIEVLLHHRADPKTMLDRFFRAVDEIDPNMVEIMLSNGLSPFQRCPRTGVTAFEKLILDNRELAGLDGLKRAIIFDLFCQASILKQHCLAKGEFDKDVIFSKHLDKLSRVSYTNRKAKLDMDEIAADHSRQSVRVHLTEDKKEYVLELKNTNQLTSEERQQIKQLFKPSFDVIEDNSEETINRYLNEIFPNKNENPVEVQLIKELNGKYETTIGFAASEVLDGKHPLVGRFKLFHAMLSLISGVYKGKGFANLIQLNLLSFIVKNPELRLFYISKLVYPYAAAIACVPHQLDFYKRYYEDSDFLRYVASMIGEQLIDGCFKRKLAVKMSPEKEKAMRRTLQFKEAERLTHGNPDNALPLVFEVTPPQAKLFKDRLGHHAEEVKVAAYAAAHTAAVVPANSTASSSENFTLLNDLRRRVPHERAARNVTVLYTPTDTLVMGFFKLAEAQAIILRDAWRDMHRNDQHASQAKITPAISTFNTSIKMLIESQFEKIKAKTLNTIRQADTDPRCIEELSLKITELKDEYTAARKTNTTKLARETGDMFNDYRDVEVFEQKTEKLYCDTPIKMRELHLSYLQRMNRICQDAVHNIQARYATSTAADSPQNPAEDSFPPPRL